MIYVDIVGRLGNQFFQYAFAKKVSILTNQNITINTRALKKMSWEFDLNHYNIKDLREDSFNMLTFINKVSFKSRIVLIPYIILSKTLFRSKIDKKIIFQRKWQTFLNRYGAYYMHNGYEAIRETKAKNIIIKGHFENPALFDDIKSVLQDEFTPKHEPLLKNLELYQQIDKTESVCVSIRRGDYYSSSEYTRIYGVCNNEYYQEAIKIISNSITNPVFFVFSDDIQWVKDNIKFPENTFFEEGNDPVWEKMRLMYSCKHFIISNSTFSWWAQYLSRNKNKIVISPKKWRNDSKHAFLIDKSFITI